MPSHVWLFVTLWTVAHQVLLSMRFFWQEYWKVLVSQSCPTLCDRMDCSLPGSSVHGLLQAGMLEWVSVSYCRGSSWPGGWTCASCIGRRILDHQCHHASVTEKYNPKVTGVRSLSREGPPKEEMSTHSSILAWSIPWTEEPGKLQSIRSQRVERDWNDIAWHGKKRLGVPSILTSPACPQGGYPTQSQCLPP